MNKPIELDASPTLALYADHESHLAGLHCGISVRLLNITNEPMQQYAGYWIYGTAVPGPPYTLYWESEGQSLNPPDVGLSSKLLVCVTLG